VRQSYGEPAETYEINVMGTVNLLEAVRACRSVKGVVNVTTDKCYQNNEWLWGYRESEPLGGYDPYSSKQGLLRARDGGLPQLVPCGDGRCGGDRARRQRHRWRRLVADRLVPDFFRAESAGRPLEVRFPDAVRPCSMYWNHCPGT